MDCYYGNLGARSITFHSIERFYSRGQHLCKFIGTKESVYIRKEFNSQRIFLVDQHGRRFIVLEHQYGRRDVMWKRSILRKQEGEEENRETGKEIVAMVAILQADLKEAGT